MKNTSRVDVIRATFAHLIGKTIEFFETVETDMHYYMEDEDEDWEENDMEPIRFYCTGGKLLATILWSDF